MTVESDRVVLTRVLELTAQATRLLIWISGTVLAAAGSPDVLLLGDFNSYAKEDPITTLSGGGFVVDISETLPLKLTAIRAYKTQFPAAKEQVFQLVESQNRLFGVSAFL